MMSPGFLGYHAKESFSIPTALQPVIYMLSNNSRSCLFQCQLNHRSIMRLATWLPMWNEICFDSKTDLPFLYGLYPHPLLLHFVFAMLCLLSDRYMPHLPVLPAATHASTSPSRPRLPFHALPVSVIAESTCRHRPDGDGSSVQGFVRQCCVCL